MRLHKFQSSMHIIPYLFFIFLGMGSLEAAENFYTVGAMGDSLSTAFNAQLPLNNKSITWTTGTDHDKIESHYLRLQKIFPQKTFKEINVAVPGIPSKYLPLQARWLSRYHPDYVTVTIGANDICNASIDDPLNVPRLIYNVEVSLDKIIASNPNVKILIGLVPDILKVTHAIDVTPRCQFQYEHIPLSCKIALSPFTTEEEKWAFEINRGLVNETLGKIAQKYSDHVKVPPPEVANYDFGSDMISNIDCFHPNLKGQQTLAEMMWQYGWFN